MMTAVRVQARSMLAVLTSSALPSFLVEGLHEAPMLFLLITIIPFTLYLLHFLTGIQTKTDLRQRITDLYILLADLSQQGEYLSALIRLEKTMERSKKWFLIYFVCVSFACAASTFPAIIVESRKELENIITNISNNVIDLHFNYSFDLGMVVNEKDYFYSDNGSNCVARMSVWNFIDSKPGQKEKITAAIQSFSDAQIKWVFALSEILSGIFTFVTVGTAVIISMSVTIFALSRLARSGLYLTFSVALSLIVALLSPFILIELLTYITIASIVTFKGGLPDFFNIDTPNVMNVAIANATTMTLVLLNPESVLAVVLQKLSPDSWAVTATINYLLSTVTIVLSWDRLTDFLNDLIRFNNFDFNASALEGIRNWGVGIDVAFSITYLILSLMLVAADRREPVREYMLKELQEIDSSTDGPFLSIANKTKILLGAALALFAKKS